MQGVEAARHRELQGRPFLNTLQVGHRSEARSNLRLPDFLGVGPPRTGTSWLSYLFAGHAGLPRGVKDTHFFRSRYSLGLEWYAKHFERYPPDLPVGEICPAYFAPEQIRERVKLHVPGCRVFCALREPAERMYSHYKDLDRMAMIKGDFAELAFRHPDLVDFSRYAYHVRGWQQQFGRENVLVLIHEDSGRDRQTYIDRICSFIGIPSFDVARIRWAGRRVDPIRSAPRNRKITRKLARLRGRLSDQRRYRALALLRPLFLFWSRGGATYPPLDPELKGRIRAYLRPEIDALEELIGRDLSQWK